MTECDAGLIVVGVNGSEASLAALRWAVVEGECTGARVEAVYVYANPPEIGWYVSSPGRLPPALPPDRATVVRAAEAELACAVRRAVGEVSATSVTTTVVQSTSASDALARSGRRADLLVVGAHHLTGLGRISGSTTAGVLRHAPCPVVVVPNPHGGGTFHAISGTNDSSERQLESATLISHGIEEKIMSSNDGGVVVVGVDGSPDSKAAVKWADRYASATGSTLRLVTSWAWPESYGIKLACDRYLPHEEAQAVAEEAKSGVSTPQDRVETWVRDGAAGPVLAEASDGATTLVVGSHGHSAIGRVLVGSVSSYCLHHAKCSVVVVR